MLTMFLPPCSHFSSWSTSADEGTDEYYGKHVYDNGQRCWNGPARSAKVRMLPPDRMSCSLLTSTRQIDLVCAPTNALLTVIEPEKCEYLFTVQTPAVCFPLEGAEAPVKKDEL